MKKLIFCLFLFTFLDLETIYCQAIDNSTAERNMDGNRFARLQYENDFYAKTDYYYTQGIFLEVVHPLIRKFPLAKLLWKPKATEIKYGLAVEHNGYTPTDFTKSEIQPGDRPYAAAIILKTFSIATDTMHYRRISTTLSTGIIGPGAGGGEMQTAIHRKTGDDLPLGWRNQIANYPVLNYQIRVEQQIVSLGSMALLSADASARFGTLSNKVSIGAMTMLGFFNQPFTSVSNQKHKVQVYGYFHPQVNLVAYDATLQGGFLRSNSYTVLSKDVQRIVYQHHLGFVVKFFGFYAEYFRTWTTAEFSNGKTHGTGGLQIGYWF